MNERIRELTDKAGIGFWGDSIIVLNPNEYGEDAFKRFAELIVREILSYSQDGDLDFMKFMIKKNFGVKE